ncbi:MAG TPA: ATP-binding protein [Chitinophagaceae bacterium]
MVNLIISITFILLLLASFIVSVLFIYQKKQIAYFKTIEALKLNHEKKLLKTQLEMQEQTFQQISREIHDNITLSLTLAKLNLNTIAWNELTKAKIQTEASLEQISKALNDLSDISKSLSSELIINQGLIQAVEKEITKIKEMGLFELDYKITGETVFLDAQKELVIFRIIQEAFNNIIKHAAASVVNLQLHYNNDRIEISILDNGKGFCKILAEESKSKRSNAGLNNMRQRATLFNGSTIIDSELNKGTHILITIPY